jgi:hypothetical protein
VTKPRRRWRQFSQRRSTIRPCASRFPLRTE